MAEKKRQCGTCRFFVESESGGHGKCSHPKRDKALREMVLLRPNELGCRTKWGTSLWQDPADESDPLAPESPQQPTLPDPIPAQLQYDDEVTSVSIAGSKSVRPSFEDDVVDSGAVGSGMGSWNDHAQEERRRLMISGERDALAGARKRHMERKAKQRELIPFAEEESEPAKEEPDAEKPAEPEESVAASKDEFPPDDYVEDERSSDKDVQVHDDELVDDGVRPGGHRSPRMRKLMRENKSPKNHKAMGLGTPAEMSVTSHNPENREQWNSVPSMTPGFELPLLSQDTLKSSTPLRVAASAAPMSMSPSPSRPVSQARELVSEDRLRQERSRRHVDVPMAEERPRANPPKYEVVTNRPRVSQAPKQETEPVDRLKSSLLRGHHPAIKAAAARAHESEPRTAPTETGRQQKPASQPERVSWRDPSRSYGADRAPRTEPPVRNESNRPPFISEPQQPSPERRQEPRQQQRQNPPRPERQVMREAGDSPANEHHRPRREREPQRRVEDSTPFVGSRIEISPEVPRACGTCASFRPSGVEGRGSCANEFAGPVQRVVFEQDLACQHTFGSHWVPADEEVWLEEFRQDYPPTPRVDAMLEKRRNRPVVENPVVLPDLEELTS